MKKIVNFRELEDDLIILRMDYFFDRQISYFIYLKETNEYIGYCDLRLYHNPELYYYGNIGYRIEPAFRGNNYARRAALMLIDLARDFGMKKLIVTCNPENEASRKTIEAIRARYIKTVRVPFWHPLFPEERKKMIYQIDLEKKE
ncbi:MAG: GNAT family N-acetyltransferase [Bacillota bacterium]|jgi:tagatose 1,6-diphosphate aldolase|nr:GNAT family N-acetyltransferase [Bacillota bacterium]NLL26831.1 GNAT family N-acetyltransferase [Erysipelotrichia bacterium]